MSLNQTNLDAIIFDIFDLYHKSNRQITTNFPNIIHLQEILSDKMEKILPITIDQIQGHLNDNFADIVLSWVEREYDYSMGALALSSNEFSKFFRLEKDLSTTIINKMLVKNKYIFLKEAEQKISRIQLNPTYSRNYWVRTELVPHEAEALLEIGALLETPLISDLKRVLIKNHHLIKLDLRSLKLGWVPDCIGDFPYLQELNLQNNLLVSLPDTIGRLAMLKYLDLESNLIASLPETIGNLRNLRQLWARSNRLISLPDSIGKLKALKRLSIANNKISLLPAGLYKLKGLEYLDIRRTLIKNVADLVKAFPNVHVPDIPSGKPLIPPPFAIELGTQGSIFSDEDLFQIFKPQYYQIFILGNKGAGKTSLLRKWRTMIESDSAEIDTKLVEKHNIKDSVLYSAVDPFLITSSIEQEAKDSREVWERGVRLKKILTSIEEKQNCFEFWELKEEELKIQLEMAFFQGCDGILLCVDVSDEKSVDRVISTLELLFTLIDIVNKAEIRKIPILVVGTKGDEIDIKAESKMLQLCQELESKELNLISFHMDTILRFFCEWNKVRQAKFSFSPELWIKTSAKTGENVPLAFKIIEIATKEQQRANDFKKVSLDKRRRRDFRDFEGLPTPYIYYFPYPKGPPAASGHTQVKKIYCPYCEKIIDYLSIFCPYCKNALRR